MFDVIRYTGVSRNQYTHWCDNKLIAPIPSSSIGGTGNHYRYSFRGLVYFRIAVILSGYGMTVPGIRRVLSSLRPSNRGPITISCVDGCGVVVDFMKVADLLRKAVAKDSTPPRL
jgi:DNA-binding transcriptional MerR regulator